MTRTKKGILLLLVFVIGISGVVGVQLLKRLNPNPSYTIGQAIDSLNGVNVYYNKSVNNVVGRTVTSDGYNLGLKYQCVEFVKRYYYEYYKHKMPDSYGHAKSFFDPSTSDGKVNTQRDLLQFSNGSSTRPEVGDLIVFSKTIGNPYGHVAIVSQIKKDEIEIIQQNPGPYTSSRIRYGLEHKKGKWRIENKRILGWLRMRS